ncbi:MAG: branched-chain amino acid transport system permease protein [bacterium]|nr:branched-chain amino acid transport system permease protein [Solirubrobacteraceae bacterium]
MTVDVFLQQLVNAVSLGGTYALLALGLAMVFSIFGLINFAHGDLMTIAGFTIYFAMKGGIPFLAAILLGIAAAGLAALIMERVAFRPLRGSSVAVLMLASMAVSGGLQVLFQNVISARPVPIVTPQFLSESVSLGGFDSGVIQLISLLSAVVVLILMSLFLKRTTIGISMRAAAENFAVTRLMGIRADRVIGSAFVLSGILAGGAAVLWVSLRGSVDPMMGILPMFKAFIATIIGGLGSLSGAVAGGFLLGFIDVGLQSYLPPSILPYQDAISFAIVIGVLLFRPQGILGRPATI